MKKIILLFTVLFSLYLSANATNSFTEYYYQFTDACGKTWGLTCSTCTSSSGFADAINTWKVTHYAGTGTSGQACYSINVTTPPPAAP